MYSKCNCSHYLKDHTYDSELEVYNECKKCDCEGFDLIEYSDATELQF